MRAGADILVIEDDESIQEMLAYSLEPEGYKIRRATTVNQGWDILNNKQVDLVLLDWMLPDQSGIDMLHRIRKLYSQLPVIMLTAKAEEEDRVRGLDIGADDYITKPFSLRELKSRIAAVLRRSQPDEQPIRFGDLYLDPVSQRITINDEIVNLSPTEFRLMHYFMSHPERVFSRSQLLDHAWGTQVYVEERTVDVHIRRLRKSLEPYQMDKLIQTVHGSGYRFTKRT